MTRHEGEAQSIAQGGGRKTIEGETPAEGHLDDRSSTTPAPRDPSDTLHGCQRILILGRTGSGKTIVIAMAIAWHILNKATDP